MSQKHLKHNLQCGSCSGLNRDKLVAGNTTVCAGQGKIPSARTCSSYRTDVFALAPVNERTEHDMLHQLAECVSEFTLTELQVLAALFLGEKKTRQNGYRFWQKIYVRIRGTSSDNYLNNFVVGRVLDADREFVRVISETGKSCIQVVNDKQSISLYTIERFRPLRSEMVTAKKFIDPSTERALKKQVHTSIVAPIDFAVASGLVEEEFSSKNKKVRKSHRMDLVSLVQKMSSGKILKRKEKVYNFDDEVDISHI